MKSLPGSIRDQFESQGHWVLSKTNNKFSAIPIDQTHEQENALVKWSSGFIGLTENPAAFRRWMLSAPELARLKKQFEEQYFPDTDPDHEYRACTTDVSTQLRLSSVTISGKSSKKGFPIL